MLESKIQAKIIKYLKKETYCIKIVSGNRSGILDIVCCVPVVRNNEKLGLFVAFEVKKSDKEEPSDLQKENIEMINSNFGLAFVVSSLEEVENIIRGIKCNH